VEVPLILREEIIGTLTLEMDRDGLTADEQAFIENVNTQTAIALENARLLHETERRAAQEQRLNELAARFSRAQTIDEILRAAVQELGQLPAVAQVSVQLNPDTPMAHRSAAPGHSAGWNGKERTA
jgi:GAF domain-containing protein